jgi:hypothetical protein
MTIILGNIQLKTDKNRIKAICKNIQRWQILTASEKTNEK